MEHKYTIDNYFVYALLIIKYLGKSIPGKLVFSWTILFFEHGRNVNLIDRNGRTYLRLKALMSFNTRDQYALQLIKDAPIRILTRNRLVLAVQHISKGQRWLALHFFGNWRKQLGSHRRQNNTESTVPSFSTVPTVAIVYVKYIESGSQ